jgi:hypothetical protein
MAAKKVDIMEIRQLLLLKDKSESNRSCEKLLILAETKEFYDHLKEANGQTKKFYKELEKIRKNKKLHFWMNSGLTKFSTVHSYKGWEIKTLFLIVQKDTLEATYKELVYTGFTRCMNNLVIIDIDDKELSEFMDELQFVEKIENPAANK